MSSTAARAGDRRAASARLHQLVQLATAPVSLTLGLTAVLAAAGAALQPFNPDHALLDAPGGRAVLAAAAALGVCFFVAELGQALIEVRRQAYSFSMTGIPLVLALLYLPPGHLVVVRILAAVVAFSVQRAAPLKFAFNTASYFLDTALVLLLSHALVGEGHRLDLRTAALVYVSLALVDTLMSLLVMLVIRINEGPFSGGEVLEVLMPAAAFVVLNTGIGFLTAIALGGGGLGAVLIGLFAATITVVYRGYLVLRARHQSLQLVQDFVAASEGASSLDGLASRLLTRIRNLVRAARIELSIETPDGRLMRFVVDENDEVHVHDQARRAADRPPRPAGPHGPGSTAAADHPAMLVSTKTADRTQRDWLAGHRAQDALVVPLTRSGPHSTLLALDRLGDSTAFTVDDLALLQTLAGHLAVALESIQLVERLTHDATHDVLTGLPNRSLLSDRLRDALDRPRGGRGVAVLLLDLDRFKDVNDALGHHVGDELLGVVAERLRALPLSDATVARLGGDEFAILLPAMSDDHAAERAADLVGEALAAPVDLPEVTVSTRASVGIALAEPGDGPADLLRHADTAMYAAKADGIRYATYSPDLDAGRADRLALLADLHQAIEADQLEVHYQPKLDLAFGVVTGVEALVRWTHPTLGQLPPDQFIPLAESTGLIDQLTALVLRKALRQCRAWQDAGLELTVAVNLSARNVMNADLPDHVAVALVDAGLPAQRLTLEITESAVMADPDHSVTTLERLADIGVTLSLDDFGTGYSSLSYLQRLPVREVKIDRSFVLGLTREDHAHSSDVLVRSIINLGSSLGLRIVAEGVEDADVLDRLRELGCDIAQGYHIGRPVPGPQILKDRTGNAVPTWA